MQNIAKSRNEGWSLQSGFPLWDKYMKRSSSLPNEALLATNMPLLNTHNAWDASKATRGSLTLFPIRKSRQISSPVLTEYKNDSLVQAQNTRRSPDNISTIFEILLSTQPNHFASSGH